MDRFSKLVIAVLLAGAGAGAAHAGYAQLAPPSGFTTSSYGWGYAASANDAAFGRVLHQPNGLTANVAGQTVRMPAAYRLAANAPRIAAAVIYANPALRTAVGIASWLGIGKVVWDELTQTWRQEEGMPPGTVVEWRFRPEHSWTTMQGACGQVLSYFNAIDAGSGFSNTLKSCDKGTAVLVRTNGQWSQDFYHSLESRTRTGSGNCPAGWTPSPAGCLSPALTQPEMVELLNPANQPGWPMPSTVPLELPKPTTLPVEQPFINPAPGPNPAHRPQFIPTGNPVRNPNYDPSAAPGPNNSPWLQPGVRMVPSPTPAEPWRVDYQPINRPVDSPDPNPDPSPDDPSDSDKPREDSPDLCQLHPDILACQKLDEVPDTDLPTSEKPISITPDSGWGSDNAACPAPRHLTVQGRDIPIPFDLFCRYMEGMRPIILAMAWLSAAFILLGAREGNG